MLKAFVTWALTISLAIPGFALTREQTTTVNDFLKTSGLVSGSITWKEFYGKFQNTLPTDVRREMALFLEQNPQAKIPQGSVSKFTEGKNQIVELTFKTNSPGFTGSDKAVLRIDGRKEFAILSGTQAGKKFEIRLTQFELRNPVRLISAISGVTPLTEKIPTVQVLTSAEINKLVPQLRKRYIDQMRALLATAERTQNVLNETLPKKTSSLIESMMSNEAWAADAPSGSCIVAGWPGTYQNGSCRPPAEARNGSCTDCYRDMYGRTPPCLPTSSDGKLPLDATRVCNDKTESTKYAVFNGVRNEDDVETRRQELSAALTAQRERCAEVDAGVAQRTRLPDQIDACNNLRNRIGELENVNCQILSQHSQQFRELRCHLNDNPPATTSGRGGSTSPGAPALVNGECVRLPASANLLICPGKEKEIDCTADGGAKEIRYYCECAANETPETDSTAKPIGCRASSADSGSSSGSGESGSGSRKGKSESWFKPWMGVAAVGVVGIALWYYGSKEKMDAKYKLITPTPVAAPVYIAPTTTPAVLAPVPTDVTRPAPATR